MNKLNNIRIWRFIDPEQVVMVEANPFTRLGYEHKQQDENFHLKNLGSSIKKIKIFLGMKV